MGSKKKKKTERFSLYPMRFEETVKKTLQADPEKVRKLEKEEQNARKKPS